MVCMAGPLLVIFNHLLNLHRALRHMMQWLEDALDYNMTTKKTIQNMMKTVPSTKNFFVNFQFILLYI